MMNKRIAEYVEGLFANSPPEPRVLEIKEELLADLHDKYQDLLADGKSEETAYSMVISGIGDIHDLLRDFTDAGPYSFAATEKKRNLGSILISVGVSFYVLSLAVIVLFGWLGFGEIGMFMMFVLLAAGTGLVVYGLIIGKMIYEKSNDTFVEQYKEKTSEDERRNNLKKAVNSAIWPLIVVIYLATSFITSRWDITWIIFLLGVAVQQFINMYLFAKPKEKGKYWYGMYWTAICAVYFIISFAFSSWSWSWMIFIAAVAVQQIIRLITIWGDNR
ncbi:MAG: permease prefix domain 1-containing protein [Clostridiales bacterium]|nr:permease prefix domain 1-containing protein [Clostridiales bacterium]